MIRKKKDGIFTRESEFVHSKSLEKLQKRQFAQQLVFLIEEYGLSPWDIRPSNLGVRPDGDGKILIIDAGIGNQ
jgi:hypothetical protein